MRQKPKARASAGKARKPQNQKEQSARFIEAARAVGVDESGKEFDRAMKKLVPPRRANRRG
jgi:hypothetical protein